MEELYGRYEAAMVLSAAGDALGYKNGEWEICRSGRDIQRELRNMGGIQAIHVKRKLFKYLSLGPPILKTSSLLISNSLNVEIRNNVW